MAERLSMDVQLTVLTRLVRGDTYAQIAKDLGVSPATIHNIKQRNPQALTVIQDRLVAHQVSSAKKILNKSQDLIERKLDKATQADQKRDELFEQLQSGEIDYKQYRALMDRVFDPTLSELNSISKEAFNQSQLEDNKPTSIPGGGQNALSDLTSLVQAIQSGDEVVIQRLVFNSPETAPREVIQQDDES